MAHRKVKVTAAVLALAAWAAPGQEPIRVEITEKVLISATHRFGINLGGDAYYSGAALMKQRVCQNFEGTTYRQCHFGPLQDEHGAATWFNPPDAWRKILIGGSYTILSGPAKGISGVITDITTRKLEHQGQMKDFAYFVFDRGVPAGPQNTGVMVEAQRLDEGQFRRREKHEYWATRNDRIEIGDVPPRFLWQGGAEPGCRRTTGTHSLCDALPSVWRSERDVASPFVGQEKGWLPDPHGQQRVRTARASSAYP